MSYGDDDADRLAYDLAHAEFDAVERDGLRAAWSDDGTLVTVSDLGGDDVTVEYNAEDLVRAESDPEVRNARNPGPEDS
jgi:YD repeat-containing protein